MASECSQTEPVHYERWVWIELIGFDNQQADYAVQAYLDNAGFIPDSVSLLFYSPDFVHGHKGMDTETMLPMEMCSYGARPYGKERSRQQWSNHELRKLVAELQKHGIEVYCAFFDIFQFDGEDGSEELCKSTWCAAHPELYEMRKSGEPFPAINPLRRMKDGSYYEDLFVPALVQVLEDYGFDGYHGADGYTSPRLSLAETDYSDDMVGQFVQWSDLLLPAFLQDSCDGEPSRMQQRADWIWNEKRMEWIQFHGSRWAQLWQKIMVAIRKAGKKAYVNSAWTREPFEALYRYGVDYKLLAETGIDGFIVETVGASLSAGAGETEYEPGPEFMAMLMLIKAYVPDTKLICLNALQDTHEQWDAISHAPTVLERDIYTLTNMYLVRSEQVSRCAAGFMACLGDGISREGWKWIAARWNLGFAAQPQQITGATLVWSDTMLHASMQEYIEHRNWPVHKYTNALLLRGAPIHAAIALKDLPSYNSSILVTNLHLLSDEELHTVLTYRNGAAILLGEMTDRVAIAFEQQGIACERRKRNVFCASRPASSDATEIFYMDQDQDQVQPSLLDEHQEPQSINDEITWVKSLYFQAMSVPFLTQVVQALGEITGAPKLLKNEAYIRVAALAVAPQRYRLILTNLHINYKSAHIDMGQAIRQITVLTDFPGVPVKPLDSQFSLYVPGRGTVIVEVSL